MILAVEDNPGDQRLFTECISADVHFERDGEGAVQWLTRHAPETDAVFVDYRLPGMDGVAALRAMREIPGAADVLYFMLSSSPPDFMNAVFGTSVRVVTKPDTYAGWLAIGTLLTGLLAREATV